MKLVRYGEPGRERPAVLLEDGSLLDVRAMAFDIEDYNSHFFERFGLERVQQLLHEAGRKCIRADGLRLGPPIARPSKIICLGKNYVDHAREFDTEIPAQPILFSKAPSAIIGPYDSVRLPKSANSCDIEVELAVVVKRRMKDVKPENVWDYVAGFTILDDVTDRAAQRADKQWFRAKSADTFCPIGPWLVTLDELPQNLDLRMRSYINDLPLQDARTSQMIFSVPVVLSFISRTITLEPGDIVATGTPGGIGSARNPPIFLKPGNVIRVEIDHLGYQTNSVVASA